MANLCPGFQFQELNLNSISLCVQGMSGVPSEAGKLCILETESCNLVNIFRCKSDKMMTTKFQFYGLNQPKLGRGRILLGAQINLTGHPLVKHIKEYIPTSLAYAFDLVVHPGFKGCGMGPWLVLVSPCFRENVVATCKIGSFLYYSLNILLQKNVIVLFFGNQISKWRSFEKSAILDLLFTFSSHQGKVTKIP